MATRTPSPVLDLDDFHRFALWMLADPDAARAQALAIVQAAPDAGFVAWVATLVRTLAIVEPRGRGHQDGFVTLAERLHDADDHELDPMLARDPARLHVLRWELKQACLLAAVRALWPTRRALFVLMHVLPGDHALVAEVFETSVAAVRLSHARTLRTLADFLEPRCQHLSPTNPCRCDARLGVALARGLVAWPPQRATPTHDPFDARTRGLAELYGELPPVALDPGVSAALVAARATASACGHEHADSGRGPHEPLRVRP